MSSSSSPDDNQAAEAVRQCSVDDVFVQEDISEVWEHLEDNDDKMFRLRLIWVLAKQKRDAEVQKAKQRQIADLVNGIEVMDVSEPEEAKRARQKAVETAKPELVDLMNDLSNLSIQRKGENMIQSQARMRAVSADWMQYYH